MATTEDNILALDTGLHRMPSTAEDTGTNIKYGKTVGGIGGTTNNMTVSATVE
jgi:hypothetical protein